MGNLTYYFAEAMLWLLAEKSSGIEYNQAFLQRTNYGIIPRYV